MFREELKKLLLKQFGLIFIFIFIIAEIILVKNIYPKRSFSSDITKQYFYEYAERFSGKLTKEVESEILSEQERIIDAQNAEKRIENALIKGNYQSEGEFISEYAQNHEIAERSEGFNVFFKQYSYAKDFPENRYLITGTYDGLYMDFPNVFLLVLVIFMTAFLFQNEESSNMITFIRISKNGKQKTLFGKLFSIIILIVFGQLFSSISEFVAMTTQGSLHELGYPIQSIEYFQNCPYNISVIQGFLAISALRLLGLLFIAAFVIFLSVTVRRALFTAFVPSAVCLLQQFTFNPATPAYYIPTGFLRAVGYFRGDIFGKNDSGDNVKYFSEIPLGFIILLVVLTVTLIAVFIIVAYKYYSCVNFKRIFSKTAAVTAMISFCIIFTGCSRPSNEKIKYNQNESIIFAQNQDSFFISGTDKIVQISKSNNSETEIYYNAFSDGSINMLNTPCVVYGDDFYYLEEGNINMIDLSNYNNITVSRRYYDEPGFLGITALSITEKNKDFTSIPGFFYDGRTFYYVYVNGVTKNGEIIINEKIYNGMLCSDGQRIYYINSLLQFKCCEIASGETTRLPGEFVRSIYYDGTRLLYSDRNGIFALDAESNSTKISDVTAEILTSDGERIVYQCDGKTFELYSEESQVIVIIPETDKLVIIHYGGQSYEFIDLPAKAQ